jgi:hypothetical protein
MEGVFIMVGKCVGDQNLGFNSLTTIGQYMAHMFFLALFKTNNFLNFCPLITFDSSKCS